ncbi:MAG: hypothetical protein Q4G58_14565 [bacterium]|nr:hypothetical protein [bacterium]
MERNKKMRLYFGDWVTTLMTIFLITIIGFIVYSYMNRNGIHYWGRRTFFLAAYGLVICCYAATRDGLDKTIQCAIDGSCAPGIFPLVSLPTIMGCIGAAIILVAGIGTLFTKSQQIRQIMFFVMSGGVFLKIFMVEISRIFRIV